MQNQYEEVIKIKPSADRQKALEFIKGIYMNWLPDTNMIVNELTIIFFANGEHEFGLLSNASLDFGECYEFRDENIESWFAFYRDESDENADLSLVYEEWRKH